MVRIPRWPSDHRFSLNDGAADPSGGQGDESGEFTVRLCASHYSLFARLENGSVGSAESSWVVRSITSAGREVLGQGLSIGGSGEVPVEILLARDGGRVSGVVRDQDDKPVGGALVLLAPEPMLRSQRDFYRQIRTDQNGRYEMPNIRPGEYKLFVWHDAESGAWFDPEFLKRFDDAGQAITVPPSGQATGDLRLAAEGK
jgi:hypothetical protein